MCISTEPESRFWRLVKPGENQCQRGFRPFCPLLYRRGRETDAGFGVYTSYERGDIFRRRRG